MDVIKATRELGKAIQQDERFIAYLAAKKANDEDEALQGLIGEFNLKRENMQLEMNKPEHDENKLQEMNKELQALYEKVMTNPNMANFAVVKSAVDELMQNVQGIIALCCEGEDPETCTPSHNCGSDCSSCGGCH